MKKLFKLLFYAAIVGGIVYAVKKMMASSQNEFASASSGSGVLPNASTNALDEKELGGEISEELLKILVCPEDKGTLELVDDGKYLLNPRNGYKYPIREGIPVMLIEEGKKHQDANFVGQNGTDAQHQSEGESA